MKEKLYLQVPYWFMSMDPVHIGTGGYRLGRVDLSIMRDPLSGVPKIPATSLAGPARAFTALQTGKYRWEENGVEYSCAGRGGEGGEKHCGDHDPACPVCIPYGFSKKTFSFQGLAQFFDAHIVFFPVATMAGPVWVTCPANLKFSEENLPEVAKDKFLPLGTIDNKRLNFGFLLLGKDEKPSLDIGNTFQSVPRYISDKSVLLSNRHFSKVVNANLEVRTSVSIDPATGAAEDKALFTYEAIPRATIFRSEILYNDPQNFRVNSKSIKIEKENSEKAPADIEWVKKQVEKGLELFQVFGIGGMNTRGMGRLKKIS
jgi:CRISPR-associated protein Cmr4